MISGSEAVVLYLISGSEDHEQEFNHHWGNSLPSSTVLFLFVHLSLLRIIYVTFLLGTVIELDRLHVYTEQCPFLLLAFNMDLLQLPLRWHMLQDQDLGTLVWDYCRTVHRLDYFRACPVPQ